MVRLMFGLSAGVREAISWKKTLGVNFTPGAKGRAAGGLLIERYGFGVAESELEEFL
ncbi:MAG: hypothetical protein IPK83_23310 [Planctomycetes bacterium]|nr:hypothetical protein [Planctomycetota bacterium]